MNLLAWIVLGLLAGSVAKFLMPGRDPGGFFVTAAIGIVGALVGGFLGSKLLGYNLTEGNVINWNNFFIATAGSFLLLFVYRLLKKR